MSRPLRSHQRQLLGIVQAIASGEARSVSDILAAVTPGGGKSLLPVIAAARLIEAGIVDRVCWVVPRDSLRLQAEEAFADPFWRQALGHNVSVRAAENAPDLCRSCLGYITTYQGIAAAPDLHLAEFRKHRFLLVVDEIHHLPSLAEIDPHAPDDEAGWSRALLPLMETSKIRLLLSGTLERADGRAILWLPYRTGQRARTRDVDLDAPGWGMIGYSRAQALAEKAVLPLRFGAVDGQAEWMDEERRRIGPQPISGGPEIARPALFTALRTGFSDDLLRESFIATRDLRATRREARGLPPGTEGHGLGKLLVVAPDQANARRYLDALRAWLPRDRSIDIANIATSDAPNAQERLAAFRLLPEPSILVTVAMAYEGLDAPSVSVVAALTHVRSRAWLEQMVARATRVDPHAGPYDEQRATVFHPDDFMFARFRDRMEREQGTLAKTPKSRPQRSLFPLTENAKDPIVPLSSNATTLRYADLAPGPDFAAARPEATAAHRPPELLEVPSLLERDLRRRIGQMVAGQLVEDELSLQMPRNRLGTHHAYSAVLKRVMGKARAEMTLEELEATVSWLERNRLSQHLHRLDDDARFEWTARQKELELPRRTKRPRRRPGALSRHQEL
jgi:superfamily II DNA or RNA helicase